MGQQIKRHIGRILLDGGFLSNNDIDHALEEQKLTRELLGQVLVRMGVLKARDINAPLLIQNHLSSIDDAVKIAAGERQLLGALLVRSGRITGEQLDRAIAEQKKTGEKLGEVFTRLGMLTERQLAALIEFQHNQGEATSGPLKLGELLVSSGYISRDQLDVALYKQSLSHKKIGEVLVEEGYISPSRIKYGFRLQKMLVNSVLAAILFLGTSVPSIAASVSLQWDPNSETDLAGYRVYYKADSSELPFDGVEAVEGAAPIDVQGLTTTTISGLDPGRTYYLSVTAYNKAGLESPYSKIVAKVAPLPDSTAPNVLSFTIPSVATSLTIPITTFTATDNIGVTGYLVTDSSSVPSIDDAAWSASAPTSFTFSTSGSNMLYAWAKDAAGNLSNGVGRSVTITLPDTTAPTISIGVRKANVSVSGIVSVTATANDNAGVSRVEFYVNGALTSTATIAPYVFNWDSTAAATGSNTLMARSYDAAGNIGQSASIKISVPNVKFR